MAPGTCAATEEKTKAFLKLVNTETVLEDSSQFIPSEKFREGEIGDGVRILHVDLNFKQHYFNKFEGRVRPATLRIWKLEEEAFTDWILNRLDCSAEIMLGQFWKLLTTQRTRSGGCLREKTTSAFIRDEHNVVFPVRARWYPNEKGFEIGILLPPYFFKWPKEREFVSR